MLVSDTAPPVNVFPQQYQSEIADPESACPEDSRLLITFAPGVTCRLVEARQFTLIPWGMVVAERVVNAQDLYGLRWMFIDWVPSQDVMDQ